MRMKRFLSLMLAVLMLASLTISASATASKVYLYEEFDYDSLDAFGAAYSWNSSTDEAGGTTYTPASVGTAYALNDAVNFRTNGVTRAQHYTLTTSNLTNYPISIVDTNGDKAFQYGADPATDTGRKGEVLFIPAEVWAPTAETEEKYVISVDLENVDLGIAHSGVTEGKYTIDDEGKYTYYDTEGNALTAAITTTNTGSSILGDAWRLWSTTGAANIYNLRYDVVTFTTNANDEKSGTFTRTGANSSRFWDGANYVLENDVRYNFKNVLTYNNGTNLSYRTYVDGVDKRGGTLGGGDFSAFLIKPNAMLTYKLYNVKMYSLSTADNAFNVSAENTANLSTSTTSLTVRFSQPVEASTYNANAVTMTKDGAEFTGFRAGDVVEKIVDGEIYSEVVISIPNGLEESSEYEIIFPAAVKNTIATALGETNNKVTFTTATPDISMKSFLITKAWNTPAEAPALSFGKDGVYGTALELKNNSDARKQVAVIYAVYAANGKLTDVVYANDTVEVSKIATIGAGVELTDAVAGGKVKAFIWDGISTLRPHRDSLTWNIAE